MVGVGRRVVFARLLLFSFVERKVQLMGDLRLLLVVVVSKRAQVCEFLWLLFLASILKIRSSPSSSIEKPQPGSVCSIVASTFLQDLPVQAGDQLSWWYLVPE